LGAHAENGDSLDEVVFPNPANARASTMVPASQFAELAEELEQTRARLLRNASDFESFRKRVERERADVVQLANESLLRDLLPILDNLERAVAAGTDRPEGDLLHEGVLMIVAQFHELLERQSVARVPGVGTRFDPAVHEAVRCIETDDGTPGLVLDEFQSGYLLGERLLRPAMVVVSAAACPVPSDDALPPPTEAAPNVDAEPTHPELSPDLPIVTLTEPPLHDDLDPEFDLDLMLDIALDDEDTCPNLDLPHFDD